MTSSPSVDRPQRCAEAFREKPAWATDWSSYWCKQCERYFPDAPKHPHLLSNDWLEALDATLKPGEKGD